MEQWETIGGQTGVQICVIKSRTSHLQYGQEQSQGTLTCGIYNL